MGGLYLVYYLKDALYIILDGFHKGRPLNGNRCLTVCIEECGMFDIHVHVLYCL